MEELSRVWCLIIIIIIIKEEKKKETLTFLLGVDVVARDPSCRPLRPRVHFRWRSLHNFPLHRLDSRVSVAALVIFFIVFFAFLVHVRRAPGRLLAVAISRTFLTRFCLLFLQVSALGRVLALLLRSAGAGRCQTRVDLTTLNLCGHPASFLTARSVKSSVMFWSLLSYPREKSWKAQGVTTSTTWGKQLLGWTSLAS